MNRVQTVTQKHHRVEKPGQKPNRLHKPPNWPSQRTRRAQARASVAVSWPAQRRIVVGLPGRIAASGCRVVAPRRRVAGIVPLATRAPRACRTPARPPTRPEGARPRACCTLSPAPTVPCRSAQWPYRGRASRAHLAVSWPRSRYKLPSCLALSHNTVYVLRYSAHNLQATSLAIQTCLLQYNLALHSAIRSKTNKLYCNTVSSITIQIGQ